MQIDLVNAATQIVSGYGVRIDGIDRTATIGPDWSTTHDTDAAFSSASLPVLEPFTLSSGRHTVELYAGWQGDTSQPGFRGEIVNEDQTYYPQRSTLTAGGYLKRTEAQIDVLVAFYYDGGTEEETDALLALIPNDYQAVPISTDADGIIFILERYGITPSTTGHSIDASWWIPAKIEPVLWDIGTSGYAIIQEWDRIADYRTADGRLGQVLRRQLYGTVPANTRHTFREGIDILDLQISTAYEVYNQVKVTGASIASLEESDPENDVVVGISPIGDPEPSSYIPDPPGVRTDDEIKSSYIETVEDAQEVADRRLGRLKQPLQTHTLTTFGCADLDIGDGIRIEAESKDVASNFFIVAHTLSGNPQRSSIRLRGSADAATRGNQPPLPQMIITVLMEHVIIAGSPAELVMITIDARASSDSDGAIVAYEIEIDGTTYTEPYITHATTSASPVPVTLTVTDDQGLTATLTQQAVWDVATTLVEPLVIAEETLAEATADGEDTWRSFIASVTAVAPIALGGTTLYGCTDGKVYRSLDLLATAPTLATTLPDAVNCLWCNEKLTKRWLAGLDSGAVHLSIDDGLTWTALTSLPAAVNDIAEDPDVANHITVAAGSSISTTYDGLTWTPLITAESGTALRFAAGAYGGIARLYAGYSDGVLRRWSDGGEILELFTTDDAHGIRGLTLRRDREVAYVFTDTTATYIVDPDVGAIDGPPTGTATNRAMRSGAHTGVYVATDAALQKWLPDQAQAYDVRIMVEPARCVTVGYGSVSLPISVPPPPPPPVNVKVVLATYHTSGGTVGGVHVYTPGEGDDPGAWAHLHSGLPERWRWRDVIISPHNDQHWLLVGDPGGTKAAQIVGGAFKLAAYGTSTSPIWQSLDAGASWTEIEIEADINDVITGNGDYTPPGNWDTIHHVEQIRAIPLPGDRLAVIALLYGVQVWNGDAEPGIVIWKRRNAGSDWTAFEYARRSPRFGGGYPTGQDDDVFWSSRQYISGRTGSGKTDMGVIAGFEADIEFVTNDRLNNATGAEVTWQAIVYQGAVIPGTQALIVMADGKTHWAIAPDYSADFPIEQQGGDFNQEAVQVAAVAYGTPGTFWWGGRNSGGSLYKIAKTGSVWGETKVPLGLTFSKGVACLRNDRQTGTVMAGIARVTTSTFNGAIFVYDGTSWDILESPNTTDQWNVCEPIGVSE